MRIRRSKIPSIPPSHSHPPSPSSPPSSPSCSSSSSSSSCLSSSTTTTTITHSTISTTHSLTSSSNSTSFSSSFSPINRCHGLDLLVKAVHHVNGSIIGVPYIQRRVIRRRKPTLNFSNLVINSHKFELGFGDEVVNVTNDLLQQSLKKNCKQKRRSKGVPSKFNDSVLHLWKPKDRPKRRSN